jgi:hypothetical protein
MADHLTARIEHLKMLQNVIDRMAGASASMKRYCLLVVAAAIAFAATTDSPLIALAAALLTAVFWALDAMYLRQERWFRALYDEVRGEPSERAPDFRIAPDATIRADESFLAAIASWSTALLYGPLILFLLLVAVVV